MSTNYKRFSTTTKYIAAVDKGAGLSIAGLILMGGIYLLFAVNWLIGLIIIAGSIAIGYFSMSKFAQQRAAEFDASCHENGVVYKAGLSDSQREFFIGISEACDKVLIEYRSSGYEIIEKLIYLEQVLNVELIANDLSIYKTGPMISLSAAAIGGATFGGAGAIVSSLATSQIGRGKISNVILKLRLNDIDDPVIEIPFLNKPTKTSSLEYKARAELAEKWTNLIEVMRFRLASSASAITEMQGNPAMASKYAPLEQYLRTRFASSHELIMSFSQIEEILGSRLPESALKYREWWSNQTETKNRPQAYAWISAGYDVDTVHQEAGNAWVRFKRRLHTSPR